MLTPQFYFTFKSFVVSSLEKPVKIINNRPNDFSLSPKRTISLEVEIYLKLNSLARKFEKSGKLLKSLGV